MVLRDPHEIQPAHGKLTRLKILWRQIRDVSPRQNWGLAQTPGVIHCGSRAYCCLAPGNRIRKIYRRNRVARQSYERDLLFSRRFAPFSWSNPVLDTGINWLGQRWIEASALPQERRLDRYIVDAGPERRFSVAMQLISAILDLHCMRVAHRDIHGRNIFCLDDGVRLIDYDVAIDYPDWYYPRFSSCYGLMGEGLESPHATNHACLFASHFSYAIGRFLDLDRPALLRQLRSDCEHDVRVLMAGDLGDDVRLWLHGSDGTMQKCSNMNPPLALPGVEACVAGTRCAGLIDTLIRRGYRWIRVWERDPFSLHVLRRWLASKEIDGVRLFDGNGRGVDFATDVLVPGASE